MLSGKLKIRIPETPELGPGLGPCPLCGGKLGEALTVKHAGSPKSPPWLRVLELCTKCGYTTMYDSARGPKEIEKQIAKRLRPYVKRAKVPKLPARIFLRYGKSAWREDLTAERAWWPDGAAVVDAADGTKTSVLPAVRSGRLVWRRRDLVAYLNPENVTGSPWPVRMASGEYSDYADFEEALSVTAEEHRVAAEIQRVKPVIALIGARPRGRP